MYRGQKHFLQDKIFDAFFYYYFFFTYTKLILIFLSICVLSTYFVDHRNITSKISNTLVFQEGNLIPPAPFPRVHQIECQYYTGLFLVKWI